MLCRYKHVTCQLLQRYVRTVMPEELKWFAVTVDHSAIGVCGLFFDVC